MASAARSIDSDAALSGPAARLFALAAIGYAIASIAKRSRWDGALALGLALVALMATSL